MRAWPRYALLLACGILAPACPSQEPFDRLVAQLQSPATREQAIDGLLVLVRQTPQRRQARVKEQVVHALAEAYRDDHCRGQLVTALALLRDPRAKEVFVAALRDADRGGVYFEAAVRSARLIGELELRDQVPVLVEALRKAHAAPRPDRNTWLERALIQSLERLGDRRAVDVLIQVLRGDPAIHDYYLNRLAARALGKIGDPRAVPALVETIGSKHHGLLLFEENRRALCRFGRPAVKPLLAAVGKRDRHGQLSPDAEAASRLLGDLGAPSAVGPLVDLARQQSPHTHRVALGETLLRLGNREGERLLAEVLMDNAAAVSTRRRAAAALGWLGEATAIETRIEPLCRPGDAAQEVLCMSAALAFARLAGPEGLGTFDRLFGAETRDRTLQANIAAYRARLEAVKTCGEQLACYEKLLQSKKVDWRQKERAALELGRRGPAETALTLVPGLGKTHPQVDQAILVGLERLLRTDQMAAKAANRVGLGLAQALKEMKEGDSETQIEITSRTLCLSEWVNRRREGQK